MMDVGLLLARSVGTVRVLFYLIENLIQIELKRTIPASLRMCSTPFLFGYRRTLPHVYALFLCRW